MGRILSRKSEGYEKVRIVTLCLHFTGYRIAFCVDTKSNPGLYEQKRHGTGTSRSHTLNIVPARFVRRVWWTKSQISLLQIFYSRFSGFHSSLLLIHFRDGPNRWSYCTKVWHRIPPLCDTPLSRSARRSFDPSRKSRQNHHRSCV